MCGIIITTSLKDIETNLIVQDDRGLDSLGIINKNYICKSVKANKKGYIDYLTSLKETEGIHLVHHRKATVGDINIDNAHPFKGDKFILMQNGTAKDFHKEKSEEYEKEVDSHNLLLYIEEHTDRIEEIPAVMEKFKEEFKEEYGILIICDYIGNILFISDGARESFLDIENEKVILIRNYRYGEKEGYKNIGFLIFDFEGNIKEQSFEEELNSVDFKKKYYGTRSRDMETDEGYSQGDLLGKKEKDKGKKKKDLEDYDYSNDDLQWEIENFIRTNYNYIDYYDSEIMLGEFLVEVFGVKNTAQYAFEFREIFPVDLFNRIFKEIKDDNNSLIPNKK